MTESLFFATIQSSCPNAGEPFKGNQSLSGLQRRELEMIEMESQNVRPVLKLFEWATSQWSIMDSVLKALGLIHLNIREDWIHQRTSQCNSKSSLCIWKPEAVCEFPAVLRFLRNLRKSGGELDSARALIVPSSLSPAFYSNYNHLIWMMTVIIIMMRMTWKKSINGGKM